MQLFKRSILLTSLCVALSGAASAQSLPLPEANTAPTAKASGPANQVQGADPSRGWFFFEDPKKEEPKEEDLPPALAAPATPNEAPPPKQDKCRSKQTWSPDCGFVDPGKDFEFHEKQREALFQQMVMDSNSPKAVEAVQYYMRWMLERVSQVSNMWQYNMLQNPELDPSARIPVSSLGLRLSSEAKSGTAREIFGLIKSEGGFFVYFSRADCSTCHDMAYLMERISKETGIPVKNAALDDKCVIQGAECLTSASVMPAAQALKISVVPTVFVYLRPNTWIRVSNGFTDAETLKSRTVQFFQGYRNAMLRNTANGSGAVPSVDFNIKEGPSAGSASGVKIDPPSENQLKDMFKGAM